MIESNNENQVLELKDGRKLGYAESGDLNGKPIFYFHGHPGSRIEIRFFAEKTKENVVHIICPDRPGCGLSDFLPERKLLDWPDDVIELADHLGINKFAVVGVSGGGPYALACAYKIPERLTCCCVNAGIGPINMSKKGMMRSNRIGFFISRRLPFLIKYLMKSSLKVFEDQKSIEKLAEKLPEPDRTMLQDPQFLKIFIEGSKEAFRSGLDGNVLEEKIYAKPWGFDLKEISSNIQVYIWHGELDVFIPVSMGKKMCKLIPNCKGYFLPNDGHLSMLNHMDAIVELLKTY
jgi:pimeloyl-ACP methyl ester carboxylesterase